MQSSFVAGPGMLGVKVTGLNSTEQRRISVPQDVDFEELHSRIRRVFDSAADPAHLLPPAFLLKYIDTDGERVTIGSTTELRDAQRSLPPNMPLKLLLCECPAHLTASMCFSDMKQQQQQEAQTAEQTALATPEAPSPQVSPTLLALWEGREKLLAALPSDQAYGLVSAFAAMKPQESVALLHDALKGINPVLLRHVLSLLGSGLADPYAPPARKSEHGVLCSVCQKPILGSRFKCEECVDFNLCEGCESLPNIHDEDHPLLKLRRPQKLVTSQGPQPALPAPVPYVATSSYAPAPPQQSAEVPMAVQPVVLPPPHYEGKFVCHVTVGPGTVILPGQKRIKIWRVKNVGKECWPKGCTVKQVSGTPVQVPAEGNKPSLNVPPATPGSEVDVAEEIHAPFQPGVYGTTWQVLDPQGVPVCEALYAELAVFGQPPISSQMACSLPAPMTPLTGFPVPTPQEPVMPAQPPAALPPPPSAFFPPTAFPGAMPPPIPTTYMPQPSMQPPSYPTATVQPAPAVFTPPTDLTAAQITLVETLEEMGFTDPSIYTLVKKYPTLDQVVNHLLSGQH